MTYTDEYLKCLYGDGGLTRLWLEQIRKVTDQIAEADDWVAVHYESPFMHPIARAMLIEPTGDVTLTGFELRTTTPIFAPTKCAECGLDGNHDTWCPHWRPYVADEA